MFEFMHNYRLPILVVIFVSMMGFGAYGAIQALFDGPPNELEGTFEVPGLDEPVEVMSDDIRAAQARFGTSQGWKDIARSWGVQEEDYDLFIWDYLVLSAAARAAGVVPTDGAVRRRMETFITGPIEDKNWNRYASDRERIDFDRNIMAINQLRAQYTQADPGGVTYEQIVDQYKNQYATVKAKMVVFDKKKPEDYVLDLAKDEDKKKLEDWFEKNPWVATQNKKPESVDVEVAYFRLKGRTLEELKEAFKPFEDATKDMVVKPEELQARYNSSKFVYRQLVTEEQDAEAEGDPYYDHLVKTGHLEREIKLARLMRKLYDAATADLAKFEELAKAANFQVAKLSELELNDIPDQPDFGSLRLSSLIWESGVGKLPKDGAEPKDGDYKLGTIFVDAAQPSGGLEANVFDDPGAMIGLIRMVGHHPARDPEFNEILVECKEQWQTIRARDELNEAAGAFQVAVDDWVLELPELKEKVDPAKKARDERVETEIKNLKLDRTKDEDKDRISKIEANQSRTMKLDLLEDMKPHYAKGFLAVAAEKKLQVVDVGPVSKATGVTPQYPEGLSRSERLNRMLRTQAILNALSGMSVGEMTGQPNVTAGLAVSMLLTEKVEPDAAELLSYPERVRLLANTHREIPDRAWSFEILKGAKYFNIKADALEERIRVRKEDRARKARQKAERDRRANMRKMEARRKAMEAANPNTGKIQPTTGGENSGQKRLGAGGNKAPNPDQKPGVPDDIKNSGKKPLGAEGDKAPKPDKKPGGDKAPKPDKKPGGGN